MLKVKVFQQGRTETLDEFNERIDEFVKTVDLLEAVGSTVSIVNQPYQSLVITYSDSMTGSL